jgi:hypothetical protein
LLGIPVFVVRAAFTKVDCAALEALGRALSDADTIMRLVHEGIERNACERRSGADLTRRLTTLDNRRRRAVDMFEMGTIEPADLQKRIGTVDAEREAVRMQLDLAEPAEIDESLCVDLVVCLRSVESTGVLKAPQTTRILWHSVLG